MGLLGLRQRLEPVGDLVEAFFARGLRHARIHVGVLVRFAGDRGLQVQLGLADRMTRRRIADRFEVFEVTEGMAGLAFRGGAEQGRDFVLAFDVSLLREIQIAAKAAFRLASVLEPLSWAMSLSWDDDERET